MPNRIIKESICTSEKISQLTDFEFRLFIGLITQADDCGRCDARPAILKGSIFPLREKVTVATVASALHGLANKGCVYLYNVDGKPYLYFPSWAKHQRVRDCRPKYPEPQENAEDCFNEIGDNSHCDNSPQLAAKSRYNPNPNPNPNPDIDSTAMPTPLPEAVIAYLNERTGKKYSATSKPTVKLINARAEDGHGYEDFVKVIDNKVAAWGNDPKMAEYLRPSTLFAPSHFEEYLNAVPVQKRSAARYQNPEQPTDSQWDALERELAGGVDNG